jgi:FixJ family two-component response regulator
MAKVESIDRRDCLPHEVLPILDRPRPGLTVFPATVFVVDDDPAICTALRRLLTSAGYDTVTYQSADAFLASAPPRAWSCLILDVTMPGLNGLDLQDALSARDWWLPIVFLTGRGDVPASVRAIKRGAVDFLTKPVEEAVLLRAIEAALARGVTEHRLHEELAVLRNRFGRLTPREQEVMRLVVTGMLNKQIAGELGASEKTIKVHRGRVMQKMGVGSLAQLVHLAERLGEKAERNADAFSGSTGEE